MAIETYDLGPGTLTLGSGPLNVSAQMTQVAVECSESVQSTDAKKVLSGEVLAQQDTVTLTWTLTFTAFQDIAAAGLVTYTWENASEEVPFVFIPSTAEGRDVTGTVRIVPLKLGGDVNGGKPESDATWRITDTPVLGAV
jgi:hypothetical protein